MSEPVEIQSPDESPVERLQELERELAQKEAQLHERERTVQELTERLTQTVEKLDRVQRVGSDRAPVSTAAFPKEVIEQQTELVDDLQRAVQLWEDMQVSCGLGRLEMQLADLQTAFADQFLEEEPEPAFDQESEAALEMATSDDDPEANPVEVAEQIEEVPEPDNTDLLPEVCPLRPPEILNLGEANQESLSRCVEQQDAYIDYLSARLQRAAEKNTAVDWESLADDPIKIKNQLDHTSIKLKQSRHFAEFELALQRTRLKRKERELKKLSEELSTQLPDVQKVSEKPKTDEAVPKRRWLQMLGMGKTEEE